MSSFENVRDLLVDYAEVDRNTADEKTLLRVQRFSLAIFSAGLHQEPRDYRPDLYEAELEALRQQITRLVEAISHLDPWAVEFVRREAERARLLATGVPEDLARQQVILREVPVTEWIDQKAISSLAGVRDALKAPIEALIHEGRSLPAGRGTKPNLVARKVAYLAGWALHAISDMKPSYWKDGSKFARFCDALFLEFSLTADTRRACEWALSQLAKDGKL